MIASIKGDDDGMTEFYQSSIIDTARRLFDRYVEDIDDQNRHQAQPLDIFLAFNHIQLDHHIASAY